MGKDYGFQEDLLCGLSLGLSGSAPPRVEFFVSQEWMLGIAYFVVFLGDTNRIL